MIQTRLVRALVSKRAQPHSQHRWIHVLRSSRRQFKAFGPSAESVGALLRTLLLPGVSLNFSAGHAYQQLRGFAKPKKAKGGEDSTPYVDVYPSVKENMVKQMEAALEALSRELSKLRSGRISAGLLDHVTVVDTNNVRSSLGNVAAVTVIDNERLRVTPFDSSHVKCVEQGIRASPLKLNPLVDGNMITVPIPKPTKEHLETMVKVVGKAGETSKISIRRARQTAMDSIKSSTGNVSKDDIKRREKEAEDLIKKFVKTVDDNCKAKEKEILG